LDSAEDQVKSYEAAVEVAAGRGALR